MANDYARVMRAIWGDPDWRELTLGAQHLYWQALTHPKFEHCGVSDWSPQKYAGMTKDRDPADVFEDAVELQAARFVVIDDNTGEILIRSFLRHDGLLKSPNMSKAMVKAYESVSSATLRAGIVFELLRLEKEFPKWSAWTVDRVQTIMKHPAIDTRTLFGNPSTNPSGNGSDVRPETVPFSTGKGFDISSPTPNSVLLSPNSPSSNEEGRPPTSRCSKHEGLLEPPNCGQCKEARIRLERWAAEHPVEQPVRRERDCSVDGHRADIQGWCFICGEQVGRPAVA